MAFKLFQHPQFIETRDRPPGMTLHYGAKGEFDQFTVRQLARASIASVVFTADLGTLYREDLAVDEVGFALYDIDATYGPKKKDTGTFTWDFDTTGATVKLKAAKEHIASYPSGSPDNPHKGAIGVVKDGEPEGADIVIAALRITVRYSHPQGVLTLPYVKTLSRNTGKTNSLPFLDFDAGELLYLGSNGSDGTETEAECSYAFAASENVTDLKFGDIANIVKQGHHYAWVEFEDDDDSGEGVTKPKRVHVERVYNEVDFASVFGWDGNES